MFSLYLIDSSYVTHTLYLFMEEIRNKENVLNQGSFFNRIPVNDKNSPSVRSILSFLAHKTFCSIGEISEHCGISVPTTSKFVRNLIDSGVVRELGRHHKVGGRMPKMYSLCPSLGYVIGVDIRRNGYYFGLMDFSGEMLKTSPFTPYVFNEETSAEDFAADLLESFVTLGINTASVLFVAISVPGRVNTFTGESYNFFKKGSRTATDIISSVIGIPVVLDNDSRLMCYGEYINSGLLDHKNILYINIGWGLGMGMILDGHLYYGANGFSGELGHIPIFDNEIFCHCGKKGCLETEASGSAAYRQLKIRHAAGARSTLSHIIEKDESITSEMLVKAVKEGDMLMIEITEELGAQLGKGLAAMINVLNPEIVILGGPISLAGDHLLMSAVNSTRKYSINIVNKATRIILGSDNEDITIYGACHLARAKVIGSI